MPACTKCKKDRQVYKTLTGDICGLCLAVEYNTKEVPGASEDREAEEVHGDGAGEEEEGDGEPYGNE